MSKRLYLSRTDSKIAGVCGGIAEYFDIDPTLVRLIAVVLIFVDGIGLLAYIVGWIVMPKRPLSFEAPAASSTGPVSAPSTHNGGYLIGLILVVLGGIFLLSNLYWWFHVKIILPLLLMALGLFLLLRPGRKHLSQNEQLSQGGNTI